MFDIGLMLTSRAIRRQLTAMPCELYLVRLIHSLTKRPFPGERLWTATQLSSLATIRFLRVCFTFASYNAGPTRIAHLRKEAPRDGLDHNKWFENVELKVAKDVGEETVIYVGNIYKYYVAYRLTANERKRRGLPVSFELRGGTLFHSRTPSSGETDADIGPNRGSQG